ncbi:hypothetical protein F5X98DRAFT_380725 [Xylaria grammica]|nr:hypothetical protein F5X98DRAFT_380725 [Xylaria grammica]
MEESSSTQWISRENCRRPVPRSAQRLAKAHSTRLCKSAVSRRILEGKPNLALQQVLPGVALVAAALAHNLAIRNTAAQSRKVLESALLGGRIPLPEPGDIHRTFSGLRAQSAPGVRAELPAGWLAGHNRAIRPLAAVDVYDAFLAA